MLVDYSAPKILEITPKKRNSKKLDNGGNYLERMPKFFNCLFDKKDK